MTIAMRMTSSQGDDFKIYGPHYKKDVIMTLPVYTTEHAEVENIVTSICIKSQLQ